MRHQSALTTVQGFRILKTQNEALRVIPARFTSKSELVRFILQLYLDGKIRECLPPDKIPSTKEEAVA